MRELQRLLSLVGELPGATPAERLLALPQAAAAKGGLVHVIDPDVDDVTDPYGADDATYRRMASQVVPAVDAILTAVAG